jgi:U3 small nucleolar RNA-associated protein 7
MITLDPEFVGSLAPPSKLTTETTFDGKPAIEIPYARLPRLERLKVSGKADETEVDNEDDRAEDDPNGKKNSREEREKRKMRGKGKSLKRYGDSAFSALSLSTSFFLDTCARRGKMSLIPPR